jgi:carboxylesterase type B
MIGGGGVESAANASVPLACLRAKPVNALLDATVAPAGGSALGGWGPKIDGKILFADNNARRARGQFVHRPMLVGNTNNEGATFAGKSGGGTSPASMTMGVFNCPSATAAKARVDAGVPAWRYLYAGEWPNQTLGPCCPGVKGAWHGAEIALIFGSTELKKKGADTPAEKVLARKIRDAWAGFAKDPQNGLKKLGWPVYNPNGMFSR